MVILVSVTVVYSLGALMVHIVLEDLIDLCGGLTSEPVVGKPL